MTQSALPTGLKLFIKRTIPARRERVFKAWTDPREIRQWFSPGEMDTPEAEVDLRVGGKYRIVMRDRVQNTLYIATGLYRDIRPPERLVFTWTWEDDPAAAEMLVTVRLLEKGDQTELHLLHEFLPNEQSKQRHDEGWVGCLDKLSKIVAQ